MLSQAINCLDKEMIEKFVSFQAMLQSVTIMKTTIRGRVNTSFPQSKSYGQSVCRGFCTTPHLYVPANSLSNKILKTNNKHNFSEIVSIYMLKRMNITRKVSFWTHLGNLLLY